MLNVNDMKEFKKTRDRDNIYILKKLTKKARIYFQNLKEILKQK